MEEQITIEEPQIDFFEELQKQLEKNEAITSALNKILKSIEKPTNDENEEGE